MHALRGHSHTACMCVRLCACTLVKVLVGAGPDPGSSLWLSEPRLDNVLRLNELRQQQHQQIVLVPSSLQKARLCRLVFARTAGSTTSRANSRLMNSPESSSDSSRLTRGSASKMGARPASPRLQSFRFSSSRPPAVMSCASCVPAASCCACVSPTRLPSRPSVKGVVHCQCCQHHARISRISPQIAVI